MGWACFGLALIWLWDGFGFAGLLWVGFGFVLVWLPNSIKVQSEANPGPTQFEHVENLFWVGLVWGLPWVGFGLGWVGFGLVWVSFGFASA